MHFEFQKRK